MPQDTSPQSICLLGGGEHARVIADLVTQLPHFRLEGCWGPEECHELPYLGDDGRLRREFEARWLESRFHLAMAGTPGKGQRRVVLEGLRDLRLRWATLIHPRAFVSQSATMEDGCFVGAGAVVHTQARLGGHAIVNTCAVVEHDVHVGQGVHLAPGSVVGGGAMIGDWAVLGLGCRVRDHVRIGEGAVIGMGAVVVSDVAPGAWVMGVPARPVSGADPHA